MHKQQKQLLTLVIIGGIAVLSSYVQGVMALASQKGSIWGGVPDVWRPVYTVSMFAAAIGFFPFTTLFLWGMNPEEARFGGKLQFGHLRWLYLAVLLPSALWLPLTAQMLAAPSVGLWWLIRIVLFSVGFGAVGLLVAVWRYEERGVWRLLAILGCLAFCWQTMVLDALIWPAYFPTT